MINRLPLLFPCRFVGYITLRILFFISVSSVHAQIDTEFWFAAPEVSQHGTSFFDRPILFRITTYDLPATVTISQPANANGMPVQTINIAANSTQSVDVTPWIDSIENKPPDVVLNYGIQISSTALISVYYDVVSGGGVSSGSNPEAFGLKGRNALGTDFMIPSQNYLRNFDIYTPTPYNSFDIVATEDNTSVTITPSGNITGHAAGTPFTIMLNKGQTYSATATSQLPANHLPGSQVTSDKPVAITVKDDLVRGQPYGGCSDLAGDQIVPVPLLGTEYIAMRGLLNSPYDQLFITATQNGTTITHNGTLVATINRGETYQQAVASPSSYIQTSAPVSVWQISGVGCEVGACQLPQIRCTGSSSVSYIKATDKELYLNLLVKDGSQGDFLLNGAGGVITAGQFTAVPNTSGQWYTAQILLPAASYPPGSMINVANTSSLFHLGALDASSGGTSYGYFSNFDIVKAEAAAAATHLCTGDTIQLLANTVSGVSYQWYGPGGFSSGQQNPAIPNTTLAHSGNYTLVMELPGCSSDTDAIHIQMEETPAVDLGSDLSVCADTLLLRALPYLNVVYEWSTGSTADSTLVTQTGNYWLKVTRNGCMDTDTVWVELKEPVIVDLGPDTGVCDLDTPYVLTSVQPAGTQYLWSNGMFLPEMAVTRTGDYWLEATRNGCTDSDTIQVQIVQSPYVYIGEDTTICEQFPAMIGDEIPGAAYTWSTGAHSAYIEVSVTGEYHVTVNLNGCMVSDTIHITAAPPPDIDLGEDRGICEEQTILLDAGYGGNGRYQWNTGDTAAVYAALSAGIYSVHVTTEYGCVGADTVMLSFVPLPEVVLGTDTTVCEETPLTLSARHMNADTLRWSDGSTGSELLIRTGGMYIATGMNDCGVGADTILVQDIFCDIWMPNAFTPNGDGVNDVFRVLGNVGRLEGFGLSIYNRWGERVYATIDKWQGWNGMYKGVHAQLGTYVYMLEYSIKGKPYRQQNSFHLIR